MQHTIPPIIIIACLAFFGSRSNSLAKDEDIPKVSGLRPPHHGNVYVVAHRGGTRGGVSRSHHHP